MFELKNKFRHLTMIEPKKQNIVRQISICLTEKYNGFQTISIEFAGRERKNFKPIDIIYGPTKIQKFVHSVIIQIYFKSIYKYL